MNELHMKHLLRKQELKFPGPKTIHPTLKEILIGMLNKDPTKRMKKDEIHKKLKESNLKLESYFPERQKDIFSVEILDECVMQMQIKIADDQKKKLYWCIDSLLECLKLVQFMQHMAHCIPELLAYFEGIGHFHFSSDFQNLQNGILELALSYCLNLGSIFFADEAPCAMDINIWKDVKKTFLFETLFFQPVAKTLSELANLRQCNEIIKLPQKVSSDVLCPSRKNSHEIAFGIEHEEASLKKKILNQSED